LCHINFYRVTSAYLADQVRKASLESMKRLPVGICPDPEARLDATVIALKTEQVQFHIPLLPA